MAPIEMGHAQPPTPAVTDSATGDGFSITTSAKGVQKTYTCPFNGSDTESDKDNFWCIGWLESTI